MKDKGRTYSYKNGKTETTKIGAVYITTDR